MSAIDGGCLCGALRYRLHQEPFDGGYCHCRICQRAAGAPVLAFATVMIDAFEMTAGEAKCRRSSGIGERWFCGDCGTQIAMRVDHQPGTIDFTIPSLDDPEETRPGYHIWRESRIGWFDTDDDLPRCERFRPDTRGLEGRNPSGG